MTIPNRPRYATRLNAFKRKGDTVADMIARAGTVGGLNAADLNFPDHLDHHTPAELTNLLQQSGMALNGLAMRYYTDPGFRLGAFTHPDAAVRRAAIDITKRGLDALAQMGGTVMTVWLGGYARRSGRGLRSQPRPRHLHRIQTERTALLVGPA
jgi:L-rhamnose isomerase